MRKYLIDFDGVLLDHKTIPTRKSWWKDKPKKYALDALWKLSKYNEIVIFTARKKRDWGIIESWLYFFGFPLFRITNIKENADVYVDDRCIRFTNWLDLSKLL
jgi:hypothetical protein